MRTIFLGAPVRHPDPNWPYMKKFYFCGENTGNLAIGASLLKELAVTDYVGAPWPENLPISPEEASEKFDRIIIPAANFLYRGFDFERYAQFIEKTSLPCAMVGLGAQAPSPETFDTNIPAGTLRLLSIVAERTKSIGVRGHFSADVMNKLGFKNVRPVGCPSIYRAMTPNLSVIKRQNTDNSLLRVVINGSRNVYAHSYAPAQTQRTEAALIDLAIENGYDYIVQNEQPEMDVLLDRMGSPDEYADLVASVCADIGLTHRPEEFLNHIISNYKTFFDIDAWAQTLKGYDFSLGSRLHGTILALTSGTPALLISHDTRTREMAELCGIPHMPIETVGSLDVDALYTSTHFDAFEARYRAMYSEYIEFLEENNLEHNLRRQTIDSQPTIEQHGAKLFEVSQEAPRAPNIIAVASDESLLRLGANFYVKNGYVYQRDQEIVEAQASLEAMRSRYLVAHKQASHLTEVVKMTQSVVDERGERIAELERAVSIAHEQASHLTEMVKMTQSVVDERGERIAELERAFAATAARAIEAISRADALTTQTAATVVWHQKEITRIKDESKQRLQQEMELLEARVAQAMLERDAILMSTTWQITKPIRFLGRSAPHGLRRLGRRTLRVLWWACTFRLPAKLRERRRLMSKAQDIGQ